MSTSCATLDAQFVKILQVLIDHNWVQIDTVEAVAAVNKTLQSLIKRQKLQRLAVRLNGYPISLRIRYWLRAGDVKTMMQELLIDTKRSRELFLKVAGIESLEDQATLEMTGVEGEIGRDIERTFPTDPFFSEKDDGRRLLGNVLKAISAYADDIRYCQGMNYVVAVLLLVMREAQEVTDLDLGGLSVQEAAFWVTVAMIRRNGMADLWKDKMPGFVIYILEQRCKIVADIYRVQAVAVHLPFPAAYPTSLLRFIDALSAYRNAFRYLSHSGTIAEHQTSTFYLKMVLTRLSYLLLWFVTVFARVLKTDVLVRFWDLFLMDGWKAVYRVALAIIEELRPKLLIMDLEQCSEFFRKNPSLGLEKAFSPEQLLQCALKYKVTRSSLKKLEEERHFEYLRLRLQQTPLSEEHRMLFPTLEHEGDVDAQRQSFKLIRSKLQHFDTDVANDTVFLQNKIEVAEKAQAQAMSVQYAIAYELSETAIELNERIEIKTRLRSKFCKLLATAITEATTSSTSSTGSRFTTWMNPFRFINKQMVSCLEHLPLLSRYEDKGGVLREDDKDTDDEEDEEVRQNLKHLDILVPRLAAELRLIQRSLAYNQRFLRPVLQRTRRLQRDAQLACIEVEEAQLFKDRLADQLLQIMLSSEKLKNKRMQQLFAEVDEQHE
ncbi:hypothetical protein DD238_004975 [Peronospora effusa]|uniref:Rab-GAP TBC domain-containing protein n=1 Tax=Peronospora effusa TaxID=542832 RepID=A0A3M6VEZ6_9STRA|nr:hypothetical protein DD238_004975 [Peronospora effusa]RQM13972.1 hypothetical protein DD237_005047 [Peronospora effusa]